MPSAAPALLTTSLAELCWVLPCLVQCAIQLFNGAGPWSPASSKVGCDTMGFYSVFASMSGMTSTVWVSLLTYRAARGAPLSARASTLAGAIILGGSAFVAALPFMGAGSFKYTGEGFCYFDWHHPCLAAVLLAITLPSIVATTTLLTLTYRHGGWPSGADLLLMLGAFLSAWTLWVPAAFIGLSGAPFPRHYMISGGILGHAQALINPCAHRERLLC